MAIPEPGIMDIPTLQAALARQEAEPQNRRAHEVAVGAGLLRWAEWSEAVMRGEGAAYTIRKGVHPGHDKRRDEFEELDVNIPGQKWALVEMQVLSRLAQSTAHARSIGTLLVHDSFSPSVNGLLRMYTEAALRGLWLGDETLEPKSALDRAVAEMADFANSFDADARRRLHSEVVTPAAEALDLTLYKGNSGRWHASKSIRPTVRDLPGLVKPLNEEMASWATRRYQDQTASVHSSLHGWLGSLVDTDSFGLQPVVLDLLHAVSAHHNLQELYEAWHDWQPSDAMAHARRASMSGVSIALINAQQMFAEVL